MNNNVLFYFFIFLIDRSVRTIVVFFFSGKEEREADQRRGKAARSEKGLACFLQPQNGGVGTTERGGGTSFF